MPELPEVEVTRRGIAPSVEGRRITDVVLRRTGLRWPFPDNLRSLLLNRVVRSTGRRGKYLLLRFDHGTLIIHLGMSGHLRVLPMHVPPKKHDHVDLQLGDHVVRFTDPRRFGVVLWHANDEGDIEQHLLLRKLGVEPLTHTDLARLLFQSTRSRQAAIKQVLLAGDIVVGVGNIYACEALFRAGIDPRRSAGRISLRRYQRLAQCIVEVLDEAIAAGGSTLRDFVSSHGQSGEFQNRYTVYASEGKACQRCGESIKRFIQAQRSSFACLRCQR